MRSQTKQRQTGGTGLGDNYAATGTTGTTIGMEVANQTSGSSRPSGCWKIGDIKKIAGTIQKSATKTDGECDAFTIQIRRLLTRENRGPNRARGHWLSADLQADSDVEAERCCGDAAVC